MPVRHEHKRDFQLFVTPSFGGDLLAARYPLLRGWGVVPPSFGGDLLPSGSVPWRTATSFPSTPTGPGRRAGARRGRRPYRRRRSRRCGRRATRSSSRRGSGCAARGSNSGLARDGDIHGPPPERLTGALLRTSRRPAAGRASAVRIPDPDRRTPGWPVETPRWGGRAAERGLYAAVHSRPSHACFLSIRLERVRILALERRVLLRLAQEAFADGEVVEARAHEATPSGVEAANTISGLVRPPPRQRGTPLSRSGHRRR